MKRKEKKCVTANIRKNDGTIVRGVVRKTSFIDVDRFVIPEKIRKEGKKPSKKLKEKRRIVVREEEDDLDADENQDDVDSLQSEEYDEDNKYKPSAFQKENTKKGHHKGFESPPTRNNHISSKTKPTKRNAKEEESNQKYNAKNNIGLNSPPQLIVSGRDPNNIGIISDDEDFKKLDEKKEKDDVDGYNSDTKEQDTSGRGRQDSFWRKVKYRQSIKIKPQPAN